MHGRGDAGRALAGRLFALAGDRRIRPVVGLLTLREAATRLGSDPEVIARGWRTFGLPEQGIDAPLLTEADVEAFGTYLEVRTFLGEETALGISRVVGAALARITEAESSAMRSGMQAIDVGVTGDEVVTARAYDAVTRLVPRIGRMLDTMHRQHLEATRVHFEGIDREIEDRATFRCGIGFADLSGFTRLAQQLTLSELSYVLTVFEETATDTIHARGGRIVKFLGDAVMWVSADPGDLVRIASDLATHPRAAEAEIDVRVGLAYGRLLAQDGDYFGPPVNLASRLVSVAEPGQVLAAGELVDVLGAGWFAAPGVAQTLRGFEEPVTPYTITPG
ncbi:MAG: adenylate cyclase [Frankiales bacterium]|nr:adenylate cyclase [Frankiales bacterium]